jgi:protein-S-isoprenylcysteine O-methyltransferase Ste14
LVDWVQRRRDEACFGFWAIAIAAALIHPVRCEADLLRLVPLWRALLAWLFLVSGVGLRVWAAGNLQKNEFVHPAGPYILVRHPLYLGTLAISLSLFISLGTLSGIALWFVQIFYIFMPVLRKEERELLEWFPDAYGRYMRLVPALLPNLAALGKAWHTSRFSLKRSSRNYGLRALLFIPLIPALVIAVSWAHAFLLACP